jgi:hypothetical protein
MRRPCIISILIVPYDFFQHIPADFSRRRSRYWPDCPPRYRKYITSFQLRLGPGFTNPPKGWVVNDALGLQDASNVRSLNVFVEVDTSDPIFKGFRRDDDGFYERFSRDLLDNVLMCVPSIIEIQFDAYPSVRRNGAMMRGLLEIAKKHKRYISWGPERGWNENEESSWVDNTLADLAIKMLSELTVIS